MAVEFCGIELEHPVINGSGTYDALAARRVFGDAFERNFPFAAYVSKTITLAQRDGKWLFAGFSGADLQNTPDPVIARIHVIDGSFDQSFGSGGVSLLYFDHQDIAYGEAFGAALDAHGCIVSVGTYYNGNSDEGGRDLSQLFVSRVEGDSGGANDTIFRNGFDPATPVCGP